MSKWHGGKGSKPRPITNQKEFEENWDKIFGRKKTPKHGATQVHKDKTKVIPRRKKYGDVEDEG
tara:strand:- start:9238 stop:9429 length:192 start_codon:yes stop_codon:yes gene_type:complete